MLRGKASDGQGKLARQVGNEPDGHQPINLAIMILAKDEEKNVGRILDAIAAQSLCDRDDIALSVYVVANGCTDRTAAVAQEAASGALNARGVASEVFDWAAPGKSRSWNRVVHDVIPLDADYILAIDADIEFVDRFVLAALFDHIRSRPNLAVVSGFPIKDTVRKANPTLIDRFSLSISRQTRHSGVINGSLYLARASCLRDIWLPDETPGEDGFLNAMVMTRGFSRTEQPDVVDQLADPTHYFEGHSPASYFAHEKRMIVGTMINRWIFEHLHSLGLTEPAGPMIQRLNRDNPDWVEKIIVERSAGNWLIPSELMFRRLAPTRGLTASYLARLPILLAGTMLTLPPAFTANTALKKRGASALW